MSAAGDVAGSAPILIPREHLGEPIPLGAAKSAAMVMAKGASGDYVVSNPVAHLNGLTNILLERE